ncbi:DUF4407 domain-containing protein [Pontibacter sp. G13]|uniref:DUF4407 domain-containing protein n=1 Tax=Pontibacter sp. G13 TaxID=3074898 RepID=UPI002889DDA5|nr:DUF4407 domain-containing protein [Pontibacter sp. G13]WNJ18532.1 DUF4407 domain-containing protein [Pontibacter sp. G13]
MKKIQSFFWFCAGANTEILKDCPTDHAKYFGIGGTILFTAIMAGLAGGYACFTAFDDPSVAVGFGIFWGLMIFNLDRYIVSSTGKGDGTTKITWDEWKNAFPRLAMALLLGFVIATPLELRLFQKEIDMEIETLKQQKRADARSEIEVNYGQIAELEVRVVELNQEVQAYDLIRKQRYAEMIQEAEGNSASGRPGAGKIYEEKKQQYALAEQEYEDFKLKQEKKIEEVEANIERLKQSRDEEVANIDNIAAQYDGLMAKLEAFSKLTDTYPTLKIAKWLITAMFIFIEIAPILFKMMTERGPYDDRVERIKHVTHVSEMERISTANEEVNTNLKLAVERNRQRLEAEIRANDALMKQIADAQADIAGAAIDEWRKNEMAKARAAQNTPAEA